MPSDTGLSKHDMILFQKFETRLEYNRMEHLRAFGPFVVSLTLFGVLGLLVGGLANYSIVKLQGPVDRQTVPYLDSFWYTLAHIVVLALIAYAGIHLVSRTFDDWIWSSFTGMMFWLTFLSSQTRLVTNISVLVEDR